jgi:hypothetical protein
MLGLSKPRNRTTLHSPYNLDSFVKDVRSIQQTEQQQQQEQHQQQQEQINI